jgi:polar amino acid transport system substrate-binding protein
MSPSNESDPLGGTMSRRSVLRGGVGGLAVFAAGPLLAACGGDSGGGGGGGGGGGALAQLRKKGVARMGVTETLPSSGVRGGKGVAVFPEMGTMILDDLGIKVEYVPMQFGAQVPSLAAKRIDLAAGGLYYTDERCKAIEFGNAQLAYLEGLAVAAGNPEGIRDYGDIAKKNLKVGLVTGSFELDLAKKAGVKDSNIQRFPDIAAMYEGLKAGRVQACGYDNVTISYFAELEQYRDQIDAAEPFDPVDDGQPSSGIAGMGFQKGATDLRDAYNESMAKLFEKGAFDEIYNKWSVPESNQQLTRSAPKAADLCTAAAA